MLEKSPFTVTTVSLSEKSESVLGITEEITGAACTVRISLEAML